MTDSTLPAWNIQLIWVFFTSMKDSNLQKKCEKLHGPRIRSISWFCAPSKTQTFLFYHLSPQKTYSKKAFDGSPTVCLIPAHGKIPNVVSLETREICTLLKSICQLDFGSHLQHVLLPSHYFTPFFSSWQAVGWERNWTNIQGYYAISGSKVSYNIFFWKDKYPVQWNNPLRRPHSHQTYFNNTRIGSFGCPQADCLRVLGIEAVAIQILS